MKIRVKKRIRFIRLDVKDIIFKKKQENFIYCCTETRINNYKLFFNFELKGALEFLL